MNSTDRAKLRRLHQSVEAWYRSHRRDLQWRTSRNPYELLVSEVMLQQTQVRRVQEKLPPFLHRFPDFAALARSPKSDVIRAWEGMGYNNRAVRLNELAKIIVKEHRSRLPSDVATLQTLPGVGPYTAHALTSFAFRKRVPVVDVNIRRVFSRIFTRGKTLSDKEAWKLAANALPASAYTWNQALMDLGAVICTARKPACSLCPVAALCSSRSAINNTQPPVPKAGSEPSYRGLPRRIWRGKIIQTLRDSHRRRVRLSSLAGAIRLTRKDQRWFAELVRHLEKDGLIVTRKISNLTYVSLAA